MIEGEASRLESLLVFADGKVALEYPLAVYRPDEFLSGRSVRVIIITKIENSFLGCVPQVAWDRLVAKRELPRTFFSKAVRVLVKNCREDDRSSLGDSDSVVWLGFLSSEMEPLIEASSAEEDPVEIDFGEDQLPFAEALVQIAQDHFAFFSAEEAEEVPPAAGDGSADLHERMQQMEIMMQNMSAHLAALIPTMPKADLAQPAPPAVARTLPTSKGRAKQKAQQRKEEDVETEKYPDLDPGVVAAAMQAGIEAGALEEMQALMSKNPKGVKALKRAKTAPLGENALSESDEAEAEGHGLQVGSTDPVAAALTQLTKIVGELSVDKKKRPGSSKLENALDGALVGGGGESASSLGGKKSAVARRILRNSLQESPEEIYALVERLMAEDVLSHTLQPGLDLPTFTAKGWVEHRSKIGPFKAVAHSAWATAGILDQLRKGNTAGARARCCLLLLQLDQASVDRGSWGLASDLSLEALPPFNSLSQHQPPSLQDGDLPFSKLLDPRWAELALSHLKDQDDYVSRRRTLGKKVQSEQEDPGTASPKRAAKYKAKAKAAAAVEDQ